MEVWKIYVIILIVLALLAVGYYFLRRNFKKKLAEQKGIVDQHKMTVSILVLEKKKGKIQDANLPKAVIDQIPRVYKLRKMPLITAKVGPQVVTLLCEEDVYKKLPDKKNVTVEIAGIFIVGIKNKKK